MSTNNHDISRIFNDQTEKKFQKSLPKLPRPSHVLFPYDLQEKRDVAIKLIEAKEQIDSLKRQLSSKDLELNRYKSKSEECNSRSNKLSQEISLLKESIEQNKRNTADLDQIKEHSKIIIEDYRTALSKYKTWTEFSFKQIETMKQLLIECGGWTENNRYRIYFSYKDIKPFKVADDDVQKLSLGSFLQYPTIEDIENISSQPAPTPKFHNVCTQTSDDGSCEFRNREQNLSCLQVDNHDSFEVILSEKNYYINSLESANANLKDENALLRHKTKKMAIFEEKNADLQMQLDFLTKQNQKLILDYESLKQSTESVTTSVTNISLENIGQNQKAYEQVHCHLVSESKRIARFFKDKYEKEIIELKQKVASYEDLAPSESTRILRFEGFNPLDEAYDEYLMDQALGGSSILTGAKRRRLNKTDQSSEGPSAFVQGEILAKSLATKNLQQRISSLERQLEHKSESSDANLKAYFELVAKLLGFCIETNPHGILEVRSSLKNDCVFMFQKRDDFDALDLLDSESAWQWKEVMQNYLLKFDSIPAFLSAVTISLVESPDEPYSSQGSQNSD